MRWSHTTLFGCGAYGIQTAGSVTRSGIKLPGGSGGADADEVCRCREPYKGAGEDVSCCVWMWMARCFCETQRVERPSTVQSSLGVVE
jgi:hypothetical protein